MRLLKSALTSVQSDQSLRCPHVEGLSLSAECTAKTLVSLGRVFTRRSQALLVLSCHVFFCFILTIHLLHFLEHSGSVVERSTQDRVLQLRASSTDIAENLLTGPKTNEIKQNQPRMACPDIAEKSVDRD